MQTYINTGKLRDKIIELINSPFLLELTIKHCNDNYIAKSFFSYTNPDNPTKQVLTFYIQKCDIKQTDEFICILSKEIIENIHLSKIDLLKEYTIELQDVTKHVLLRIHPGHYLD